MNDTRTILLLGKTGNGKSTLANILSGTNKFIENSLNDGKNIQSEEFLLNLAKSNGESVERIKYHIVEAVGGICEPSISSQQTLWKLAKLASSLEVGINQIFFVTDGSLTKDELETYNLLRTVVFDESIDDYLTIVRTKFTAFRNEQACEADRQRLKDSYPELLDRISSIDKIIYVDNLPLNYGQKAVENRQFSRERLFSHLAGCQNIYEKHLQQLQESQARIEVHPHGQS